MEGANLKNKNVRTWRAIDMTKPKVNRTAFLSVYNKDRLVEFAQKLHELGFDLLASRGTAKVIGDAGIPVTDIATIVGEPILGHRVVTLSRQVHAALLAAESLGDVAELSRIGIPRIDLVYVDLYPLSEVAEKKGGFTLVEVLEKTDIGGPTMLRSAAKGRRMVISDKEQIDLVLAAIAKRGFMQGGDMSDAFITLLAAKAEVVVAEYCNLSASLLYSLLDESVLEQG